MAFDCTQVCNEHSGILISISSIEKEVNDVKLSVEKQKGYVDGKFERVDVDIEKLTDKFDKSLKEAVEKIESKIESQLKSKENKMWIIIGSLISPLIVGAMLISIQHLIK